MEDFFELFYAFIIGFLTGLLLSGLTFSHTIFEKPYLQELSGGRIVKIGDKKYKFRAIEIEEKTIIEEVRVLNK